MSLTTIQGNDRIKSSRAIINQNFADLESRLGSGGPSVGLSGTAYLTFGAIPDGTVGVQTFSLPGALVGSAVCCGWPSTLEAGLFGSMRVSAADMVEVRLANLSGASITPAIQQFSAIILGNFVIPPSSSVWSVGYWNSLGSPAIPVGNIEMAAMSHIVHWAVLANSDGTLNTSPLTTTTFATDAAALIAAAHSAGVKVLLGLAAADMTTAVGSHLSAFVTNIMALVNTYGYDGVDIDWEGGTLNIAALGPALRTALGPSKVLTADAVVTDHAYWGGVHSSLDRVNVMTYDLVGAYIGYSWFNSPLYGPVDESAWSVKLAVDRFTAAGIPPSKLSIGIPFFGYHSVKTGVSGPRQTWTGPDPVLTQLHYNVIQPLINPGVNTHLDSATHTPWLSDSSSSFYSYDDEQSVADKVAYVKAQGLGGWIMFNLSEDYFPSAGVKEPLLHAIRLAR